MALFNDDGLENPRLALYGSLHHRVYRILLQISQIMTLIEICFFILYSSATCNVYGTFVN